LYIVRNNSMRMQYNDNDSCRPTILRTAHYLILINYSFALRSSPGP
jgi:hypothetical protein